MNDEEETDKETKGEDGEYDGDNEKEESEGETGYCKVFFLKKK